MTVTAVAQAGTESTAVAHSAVVQSRSRPTWIDASFLTLIVLVQAAWLALLAYLALVSLT